MRVIAGRARSLKLKTPEGPGTRPTTDRIKETLFNIIQAEDCSKECHEKGRTKYRREQLCPVGRGTEKPKSKRRN